MDETRTIKLQALREQLERDEYTIDAAKVAEAILGRLQAAREPK